MNAQTLIEALEATDYEVRSYSGRGMYGRYCVGIYVEETDNLFHVGCRVTEAMIEIGGDPTALDRLAVREDSMGFGKIIYFPSVDWPGCEEATG